MHPTNALFLGCAVCFGDSASAQTKAAMIGVLSLLVIIIFVLGIIAYTGITWIRRAKKLNTHF